MSVLTGIFAHYAVFNIFASYRLLRGCYKLTLKLVVPAAIKSGKIIAETTTIRSNGRLVPTVGERTLSGRRCAWSGNFAE